jgi:hypothetical protein
VGGYLEEMHDAVVDLARHQQDLGRREPEGYRVLPLEQSAHVELKALVELLGLRGGAGGRWVGRVAGGYVYVQYTCSRVVAIERAVERAVE